MSLVQLLENRYSVRRFKEKPVDQKLLKSIFAAAQKAPSNCNVQPWQVYVVSGEKRQTLAAELQKRVTSGQAPSPKFDWTVKYSGIHRERQFGSANALYSAMGIDRTDKSSRNKAMLLNWDFFGAPHGVFFTMPLDMGVMGAVDLGIYAQTLALLLEEKNIACCMQGALGQFPEPAEELLGIPEDYGILFGMSLGYEDVDASANKARTDRANFEDAVNFFE
jgi:nitroreductase